MIIVRTPPLLQSIRAIDRIPPELRWSFRNALVERAGGAEDAFSKWKFLPVDPYTFFTHEYYMNSGNTIYGPVMKDLLVLNGGVYDEAVLTGGIGSGKTSIAIWTQAFQLYLLSCLESPQLTLGQDPTHEIVVIFQSLNAKLAKDLDFARFKAMIERCKYFNEQFGHNRDLTSELEFPNRIIVKPVSGMETAAIGQNVIGGIIDEINFMTVTENSKQSSDGGTYDQAIELYNTIARRRKSRFMISGRMPGLLCLVSSKRTPGQFTDRKEAEALTNPRIFLYNKRVWDIKPDAYCGEKFRVFVGDESRKSRILDADSPISESESQLLDHIPIEFLQEFKDDITKALRDIAGRSTLAISPFMPNTELVIQNFGKRLSVCKQQRVDFVEQRPEIYPKMIKNPQCPRFGHLDLALRGDSAGVVVGHIPKFVSVQRGGGITERLPIIEIDLALEVYAPKGGEIEFANIRRLLYRLRELGMPIKWVTLDSYQSVDTMQILRSEGFVTGYQSMDTTLAPYQILKRALYDGRVPQALHEKLQHELITLEQDFKKGRIDHTSHGCQKGDVKVHCIDGLARSFEELTADYTQGVQHMGLTWDSAINCARPALLEKPHITKYVQELVELEFDNGLVVQCTPDHPFLLENGEYVEAKYLTPEIDLQF